MHALKTSLKWLLLALLVSGLLIFFYLHLYDYFNFSALKRYHKTLEYGLTQDYYLAVLIYMLVYTLAIALSFPVAAFITLIGGFLFGPIAIIYVVVSATCGSAIVFFVVRSTLGEWLTHKMSGWLAQMEKEFQKNALNYLLFLRLLPVFPFWVVNIVAALLMVRFRTFILATFFGMIPIKLVYVMIGSGLSTVLLTHSVLHLNILYSPSVLLPLLGLALLSVLPVVYKK